MKIKFTEQKREGENFEPDSWTEEYKSIKDISDEVKEGCDLTIIFECSVCKKEIETLDEEEANLKMCKECQK